MKRFLAFLLLVGAFLLALWLNERRHHNADDSEKYTPSRSPLGLKDVPVLSALNGESTRLVQAVLPSVVSLVTTHTVHVPVVDPFDLHFGRKPPARELLQKRNALGSGVIVSKNGHILTNNHVAAQMDEIKVQLSDGRIVPAEVIGTDPLTDLAVLKISETNLTPLPLGDSDQVIVGQFVLAIGNPLGLQETVTRGIISARRHPVDDGSMEFFQTDAAINPGNSGGPLVNVRGEVIGISTWIASQTGGSQGLGFAVPSNVARRVLEGVLKHGRIVYGSLGVGIQPLTMALARQHGLGDAGGALITGVVAGSPAEKAGLEAGDVIRKFNGRPIKSAKEFQNRIASSEIGSKVQLAGVRATKEIVFTVEVAEHSPDGGAVPQTSQPPQPPAPDALAGVSVSEIPPAARAALPDDVHGVLITRVAPDAPAAGALQPGDVIEEINRQPVKSVGEVQAVVKNLKPGEKVVIFIARGKTRSFVVLQSR